jgi:hypothetical protein
MYILKLFSTAVLSARQVRLLRYETVYTDCCSHGKVLFGGYGISLPNPRGVRDNTNNKPFPFYRNRLLTFENDVRIFLGSMLFAWAGCLAPFRPDNDVITGILPRDCAAVWGIPQMRNIHNYSVITHAKPFHSCSWLVIVK